MSEKVTVVGPESSGNSYSGPVGVLKLAPTPSLYEGTAPKF